MADERLFPLTPTDIRLKKDLGSDASANKYTVHEKLDAAKLIQDEILVDTADIQPRLISVEGDIANLQGTANSISTDVANLDSTITDPSTGLAAISAKADTIITDVSNLSNAVGVTGTDTLASHIEAIEAKLGTPSVGTVASQVEDIKSYFGTLTNGTIAVEFNELDSKISQIQNNTRTVISLNPELEVPSAGLTRYFKIILTNYDTAGGMEAPDVAPTLNVETANGVDMSSNVGDWDGSTFSAGTSMIQISEGRYYTFYRVPSTAASDQLIFTFSITENALTRYIVRTAKIVPEITSTFTASDRAKLDNVNTNVGDIQTKIGTPLVSLSSDLAAVKAQTQSIENKTDIIDTNLDTVKDTLLPEIRTVTGGVFNRDTMSLEALANAIAAVATNSTRLIWDANKTSGTIAGGASETVVLGAAEGVASAVGILNAFVINPTTSCRDYTIDIYEDSAGNKRIARVAEWDSQDDGWLAVTINRAYINQDGQPTLYVKITNNTATSASFTVNLRGERAFAA